MSRSFVAALCARFLATYGVQIQAVVLGIQIYEMTHDPFQLGLIGLAEAIPALSLALFAGHWVDRAPPVVMYRMVLAICMMSMTTSLFATTTTQLFLAAMITGLSRSFSAASIQSMVARIVARDQMPKASAWLTLSNRMALALGPATAGILYAWKGLSFSYSVSLCLASAALVATFFVQKIPPPRFSAASRENIWQSLAQGLSFVLGHAYLLPVLVLDMFSVLFGGVTAILPVIAFEVLHTNEVGLGFLRASPAVGALITSLYLTQRPIDRGAGKILFRVMAGFGLCTLIFAASHNLYLSCTVLFFAGIFDSINMVIRGAVVQLCSPDHMRGRIASINAMFIGSSNEIGAFESGTAAKLLGLIPSIYFGGCMTLFTVWIVHRLSPKMRTMHLSQLRI